MMLKCVRGIYEIGLKYAPGIMKAYIAKLIRFKEVLIYKFKLLVKYKTIDFFEIVEIEINTGCNRRCYYCPNSKYDRELLMNRKFMDEGLFRKIIDELSDLDYFGRIHPSFYGEPLLDKRLPDLVKYTREKLPKAHIRILTNGDFLTVNLFNHLLSCGVNSFEISLHESGSMSKNIALLLEYLKDKPELKKKVLLRTPQKEVKKELSKLGFRVDYLNSLFNRGGLIEVPKEILRPISKCDAPSKCLEIDVNGNVVLCCNDYLSSVVLGNLKEESIMEVWRKNKEIRRKIRKGIFEFDICKKCALFRLSEWKEYLWQKEQSKMQGED